jgi:hypothetical protein
MKKIDSLYAFVADNPEDGEEGICGTILADAWMPMIGSNDRHLQPFRAAAQRIATLTGKEVRLIRATAIEVVETIKP